MAFGVLVDLVGNMFIGRPNEKHTWSYISFEVSNEEEALSLLSYLKTKFAKCMLSIKKISQIITLIEYGMMNLFLNV